MTPKDIAKLILWLTRTYKIPYGNIITYLYDTMGADFTISVSQEFNNLFSSQE